MPSGGDEESRNKDERNSNSPAGEKAGSS